MKATIRKGLCLAVALVGAVPQSVRAAADVVGHVMTEPILGQPHTGYWHEYETHVFAFPEGDGAGRSRRVGPTPSGSSGEFRFSGLDTTRDWSFVGFQQTFFNGVPCLIDRVRLRDGKNAPLLLNDPEYSCGNSNLNQWGANPWTWANRDLYQTFVARSTSVRRIAVRVADNHSGRSISMGIVEDNGGPIASWPYIAGVGAANPRTIAWPGVGADVHVAWRSGQAPLVPGRRYAARIHGVDMTDFSLYAHNRAVSRPHVGYEQGSAWADTTERTGWDLFGIVEGDADGKHATMAPTAHYNLRMSGRTASANGQTWTARGSGLAAITLVAQVLDPVESRVFTMRVYDGPAKAQQIGPTKSVAAAWYLPNVAALGFSYCPGEINVTPGQPYYFEVSCPTPFEVDVLENESYPDGQAYYGGEAQSTDLASYVMEYQDVRAATTAPVVLSTENVLANPGFEIYAGSAAASDSTHFPTGVRPTSWTLTHDDANKNQNWPGRTGAMTPGWNSVNALMNGQNEGGGYIGYKQAGSFGGRTARAFAASIRVAVEATNVGGHATQMSPEPLRFRLSVRFLREGALLESKSTGWAGFWGAERNFVPLALTDTVTTGATDYEYEVEAVCYIPDNNGFPGEMNIVAIEDATLAFDFAEPPTRVDRWALYERAR